MHILIFFVTVAFLQPRITELCLKLFLSWILQQNFLWAGHLIILRWRATLLVRKLKVNMYTIKQNKTERGTSIQWNGEGYFYTMKGRGVLLYNERERGTSIQWNGEGYLLSYNGAKTPTHKHSFQSSAINGRQTMPRTILFYKNYKI